MSTLRSRPFTYSDRSLRADRGFTTAIHFGRQAKHMPDQPNQNRSTSTITLLCHGHSRISALRLEVSHRLHTERSAASSSFWR